MRFHRSTLLLLFAFILWVRGAEAQGLVYLLGEEATNGDDFGWSVGDAGDVDQDGHPDVIVGAPWDDANGTSSGSVIVYSGRTGELIWTLAGEYPGDAFGRSVDGLGDVDGDGASDVIVGAPLYDQGGALPSGSGRVYVLSGASAALIWEFTHDQQGGQLGTTVRGIGDVSGDGVGDCAFGSPFLDGGGSVDRGAILVFRGNDGSGVGGEWGFEAGAKFGTSIDVIRATGDPKTSRLIVGEPGVDGGGTDRGQARVINAFGLDVHQITGTTDGSYLGESVAGIGDANGDGVEDYAIGIPYADVLFVGIDAGLVRAYSGYTNAVLFTITGPDAGARFGQSLAGCGDHDGDGHDDFLIGSPNHDADSLNDSGEVRVVSGLNGSTLVDYGGGVNDHLGRSVSSAGDLNLDGTPDLIFGANDAPNGEGRAQVHLANMWYPEAYCQAKTNSLGCWPQVSWEGAASLSISEFHIVASDVRNQQFGMLFWGREGNQVPFLGGYLCVKAPLHRTPPMLSGGSPTGDDCSGAYDFHFSHAFMAAEGILPGDLIYTQFWSRDPGASFDVGLTNALAFQVTP